MGWQPPISRSSKRSNLRRLRDRLCPVPSYFHIFLLSAMPHSTSAVKDLRHTSDRIVSMTIYLGNYRHSRRQTKGTTGGKPSWKKASSLLIISLYLNFSRAAGLWRHSCMILSTILRVDLMWISWTTFREIQLELEWQPFILLASTVC